MIINERKLTESISKYLLQKELFLYATNLSCALRHFNIERCGTVGGLNRCIRGFDAWRSVNRLYKGSSNMCVRHVLSYLAMLHRRRCQDTSTRLVQFFQILQAQSCGSWNEEGKVEEYEEVEKKEYGQKKISRRKTKAKENLKMKKN